MFAVMQAVLDLRLHDHMTCKIVARDMPLLAIDQITIAALFCGGGNGRGIVDWQELCQLVGEMRPSVMAIVYASLASRSTRIVPEFPMQR